MDAATVTTAEQARAFVAGSGHRYVKVAVSDIDGVHVGKYMHRDKFSGALADGFGFCDVVLGWDLADRIFDRDGYTGWRTGFPDAAVRLLPETCRAIPFEDGLPLFLGEFSGAAEAVCPRAVLRRVLAKAGDMGFVARAGFEYELFVFAETPASVRAKHYRDLVPMAPDMMGYSVLRATTAAEVYRDLLDTCEAMRLPLEGLHEETGPGVLEAALGASDGVEAADRAALFKTFSKAVLQRRGLMATFMARWSTAQAGQSGHLHLSLLHATDGTPVFHDREAGPDAISATMRHFIGGVQALLPQFTAMLAPTVNSYRRLVPGYWAPTNATWGLDNRTVAIRAIPGKPSAQRIEMRAAGADANPYLAMAATLAAGLHGIERGLEPTPPQKGNAYTARVPRRLALPGALDLAATAFAASKAAKDAFGAAFVEQFAMTRHAEAREFARAVTDWELARYFEII
ncbi:MAG: glutamine synthetase family protein [Alphaproteobacteria bacterium]